jgi:hypothetical protein
LLEDVEDRSVGNLLEYWSSMREDVGDDPSLRTFPLDVSPLQNSSPDDYNASTGKRHLPLQLLGWI